MPGRGALSRLEKGLRRPGLGKGRGVGAGSARGQGGEAAASLLRALFRFSRSVSGGLLKPGE